MNSKARLLLVGLILTNLGGGIFAFINYPYQSFILAGIALTSLALLFFMLRIIHKQEREILQSISALAEGKLHAPIAVKGQDMYSNINDNINRVVQRINSATEYVRRIGEGEDIDGLQIDSEDTLGKALYEMSIKMRQIEEEEKKRNWVVTGMAKFSEILRSDTQNLQELSNQIIGNLVKYVGANQGGLFMEQEEVSGEKYLELMAAYAYEKQKFLEKKVYAGQGLLGQCILEKDSIYHTTVPENYVRITSGLGYAPPRNLIIIPLKVKDMVYGAVELASFQKLEAHQMDFLHKVAENIASAVASVKTNAHTQQLLEESQKLTIELQSREEEMRRNVEELSATQEEVQRKQMELDGVFHAIDATLLTAEFDKEGNITKANTALLNLLGFDEKAIKNETYRLFLGKDGTHDIWKSVIENNGQSDDYKTLTRNGKTVWLNASITLVKDSHNEVSKALLLAQDITDRKELQLASKKQEAELTSHLKAIEMTIATVEFDLKGNITDVNELYLGINGFERDDLIGKNYTLLLSEVEKKKPQTQMMWDGLRGGQSFSGEFKNLNKAGKEMWLIGTYCPIFDLHGNPNKVMLLAQFTTHEKEKQKDLMGSMHALISSVPLMEINVDSKIKLTNDIFINLLGYKKLEVVRKDFNILLTPESQEKTQMLFPTLIQEGGFRETHLYFIKSNGEKKCFRTTFTGIKSLEDKVYKIIVLLLDAEDTLV